MSAHTDEQPTVELLHAEISVLTLCLANDVYASLLMQLSNLGLQGNLLMGTLPQSWNALTSVRHCHQPVHILTNLAAVMRSCMS